MRRNVFLRVLAVTAIIGLATGCAGKEGNNNAASAPSTEAGETTAENVKLRFVSWQTAQKDRDLAVAEAYMKEHPNVTITYDYYGDMTATEYHKKVDLMVMGGEEMDILMDGSFPEHAQRAGSGTYLPMDEYFDKEGVKPEEAYAITQRVNDKVYGIPGDLKSWFILINKNYLDEAGLPVPDLNWTWDDYREYAKKLTKGDGADKRYGSYFHTWQHYDYMGMWSNYKDNPLFKIDSTEVNFDDPMFKEWLQFRYDLEQTDKSQIPYSDVTSMNMNYRDKFFNGQVAMLPIGSFIIPELDDQEKYPHDFVTTFAAMPKWKDAEGGSTYTESLFYSISKTSKHPKEAYDYIRFYTTEGMKIRGVSVSAEAGIDKMEFINKLVDDPKYVDMDGLKKVMTNPDWKDVVYHNVPSYSSEVERVLIDEGAKYLLGTEPIDKVIQSMTDKGTQIVNEKKK